MAWISSLSFELVSQKGNIQGKRENKRPDHIQYGSTEISALHANQEEYSVTILVSYYKI